MHGVQPVGGRRIETLAGTAPDRLVRRTHVEHLVLGGVGHPEHLRDVLGQLPESFLAFAQAAANPLLVFQQAEERTAGTLRERQHPGRLFLARRHLPGPPAQFQLRHRPAAQGHERLALARRQQPGLPVHHAQRPQHLPVGRHQRRAGVEAHPGVLGHQRAVGKPRVQRRVRHFQDFAGLPERVGTKRDVPRDFDRRHAHAGLEPLPVFVDQGYDRHRHLADLRGEQREVVERQVRRRIHNLVLAQRVEAQAFTVGPGPVHAGGGPGAA